MSELDSPLRSWLGRQVSVVIDRPLGSCHPCYRDLVYQVNYGYVPDTMAADGEPLDVYILGIDSPISNFSERSLPSSCATTMPRTSWWRHYQA